MSLAAIIELIIKGEPLSRLFVTTDKQAFSTREYNNIEIELTPKFKAVYFLFLNHPGYYSQAFRKNIIRN